MLGNVLTCHEVHLQLALKSSYLHTQFVIILLQTAVQLG